jgi:hypothetical protein
LVVAIVFAAAVAWQIVPEANNAVRVATMSPAEVAASEASAYYFNCDAARSAGAAPIRSGEPGYRDELDGDGDGVACELYHGR